MARINLNNFLNKIINPLQGNNPAQNSGAQTGNFNSALNPQNPQNAGTLQNPGITQNVPQPPMPGQNPANIATPQYINNQTAANSQMLNNMAASGNQNPANASNSTANILNNNLAQNNIMPSRQTLQMNTLQSIDRAIYAKDLMQMPKNLNEFIYITQKGMSVNQFNKAFQPQVMAQRNSLSQMQAQILAQLQDLDTPATQEFVKTRVTEQLQTSLKNLKITSSGMINLDQFAALIQNNGKQALSKIIMTMTEAAKSGITDLAPMKDMAKLINNSIAIASEKDPKQTMKLLLTLYLPWLPLKEGVGFDLEVETKKDDSDPEGNSILTVTITTINYGTVIATLYLETSNSVQIVIECGKEFPKDELKSRINGDEKHYSVDALTSFNVNENLKGKAKDRAHASVNMGQTTEINPYLLLMAHTVIKHVIDIDNNTTITV